MSEEPKSRSIRRQPRDGATEGSRGSTSGFQLKALRHFTDFALIGEAITQGLNPDTFSQPECADFKGVPYITTLEGRHFISHGDWIITGVQGERYPCRSDIFEATYEAVER